MPHVPHRSSSRRGFRLAPIVGVLILLSTISGCGVIPLYTNRNQPYVAEFGEIVVPRARLEMDPTVLHNHVFVGVALSGGGSRAANFSAAVLQELEELGFLDHLSAISSVSGGSLTAAYYGLYRHRLREPTWDWRTLRKSLRENLIARWLLQALNPANWFLYWFTDLDRSDLMARVFDNRFFHGDTFAQLGDKGPSIYINATDLGFKRFVFSDEAFEALSSRLDKYPISQAVMASAAFPGIFNDVTVRNYGMSKLRRAIGRGPVPRYKHLFDGGPSDNLGVETLQDVVGELNITRQVILDRREIKCFWFVIDAYQGQGYEKAPSARDPRRNIDYVIDRNAFDAIDTLMQGQRINTLQRLGLLTYIVGNPIIQPFTRDYRFKDRFDGEMSCAVWHIALERMHHLSYELTLYPEERGRIDILRKIWGLVRNTETNFQLEGLNCSPEVLQDAAYTAAKILLRDDINTLREACNWFSKNMGSPPHDCGKVPRPIIHSPPVEVTSNGLVCGSATEARR
jgi:NTE family protein